MATKSLPPLSSAAHPEKLSDGTKVWVAVCPELGIASQGESPEEAREMLREAVAGYLHFEWENEVEARLAQRTPMIRAS